VVAYCSAVSVGQKAQPRWLAALMKEGGQAFAWPFVVYPFFYKGIGALLHLFQGFT